MAMAGEVHSVVFPHTPMPFAARSVLRYVVGVVLLAALYAAAAWVGLRYVTIGHSVSLVWPSAGIAFAALVLLGPRYWPGVALGAFAANASTPVPLAAAIGIAAGNTLEALLAAYLLRRVAGSRPQLEDPLQARTLLLIAIPTGAHRRGAGRRRRPPRHRRAGEPGGRAGPRQLVGRRCPRHGRGRAGAVQLERAAAHPRYPPAARGRRARGRHRRRRRPGPAPRRGASSCCSRSSTPTSCSPSWSGPRCASALAVRRSSRSSWRRSRSGTRRGEEGPFSSARPAERCSPSPATSWCWR